jgi:hypothetical protein
MTDINHQEAKLCRVNRVLRAETESTVAEPKCGLGTSRCLARAFAGILITENRFLIADHFDQSAKSEIMAGVSLYPDN